MKHCSSLIRLMVVFTILLQGALAQSEGVATQAGTLRVATWNLLNLFDNHDHPTKPDEGTAPKSIAEIRAMARVIDAMDADVLGVQEVENRTILETLNRHLKRPYLHIELLEGNDFRGIDVGVMSRVPIEKATSHRLMPLAGDQRFCRDFPLYRLRLSPQTTVDFGVLHLKSKRGKTAASDARRKAEADGVATILKGLPDSENHLGAIIVGDFNDFRDSEPLAQLMKGTVDHTTSIPMEERSTFIYRGKGNQIDFVVSTGGIKSRSARVHRDTNGASDHFPVVVDFAVPEKVVKPEVPTLPAVEEPDRPLMKATDLDAAKRHLLQEVESEGRVAKLHRAKNGSASLNFHKDYKRAVTAYIPKAALSRFADLEDLQGKRVRVIGPISLYRKNFQIVVTRREQLQVLDGQR